MNKTHTCIVCNLQESAKFSIRNSDPKLLNEIFSQWPVGHSTHMFRDPLFLFIYHCLFVFFHYYYYLKIRNAIGCAPVWLTSMSFR